MKLLGYSDAWSVRPGDDLQFRVSSEEGDFEVAVVRLFQVDDRPSAPPYREQVIEAECAGPCPGRMQRLRTGSFLRIPGRKLLQTNSFTVTAWVYPTTVGRGPQGLFGKRALTGGFDLLIGENGRLRLELGRTSGDLAVLESPQPLEKAWYFVAAGYDATTRQAMIWHKGKNVRTPHLSSAVAEHAVAEVMDVRASTGIDLLIGALHGDDANWVTACFNGKIGSPAVYDRGLSDAEILALYEGRPVVQSGASAHWDFSTYPFGTVARDCSENGRSAEIINNPTRGVTGPHWDGSAVHFQMNPAHYDAIHFHDDDLEDAGWSTDFTWRIPDGMPSGVYAARLRTETEEDYVPFVVGPARATAPLLVILPTFTYQAYANERVHAQPYMNWPVASDLPLRLSPQDEFSAQTPALGCSIYDMHSDGTFNCYSSLLRPVVNFRPKLTSYWNGAGRHFGADMYLVDWLDRRGFAHDVATDHDLHAEGFALVSQYKVVVLGSHPEYLSWSMRRALEDYVANGGRLMYLGGNGGWWVTSVDPVRPHVIEVRKLFPEAIKPGAGVEPGEEFLSTSGQRGGSWRAVGRAPEALFGVGFCAQGFCRARGYKRQPDSFDPRVAFIFDGIGDDEIIGDFGLAFDGAAGDEFDRAYVDGATPPNTHVLASSFGHPATYCLNLFAPSYASPEEQAAWLRSDLTYYETPGGGAVFSAGSMCWCTSLPYNGYDNNVSRVTANVLRHFLADGQCKLPI